MSAIEYDFVLNNSLFRPATFCDLGIIFDPKLSFTLYINDAIRIANKNMDLLLGVREISVTFLR